MISYSLSAAEQEVGETALAYVCNVRVCMYEVLRTTFAEVKRKSNSARTYNRRTHDSARRRKKKTRWEPGWTGEGTILLRSRLVPDLESKSCRNRIASYEVDS